MRYLILVVTIIVSIGSWAQEQSFTIQDRLNSVTITPNSIMSKREGVGFDTSKNNIMVGKRNLLNPNTHEDNIAIGVDVLVQNGLGSTNNGYQSFGNIGIGKATLNKNTLGYNNIGIGHSAVLYNETGYSNIAIGRASLVGNVSGSYNIAMGERALIYANSSYNLALGANSLENLNTGNSNIGIGFRALRGFGTDGTTTFSNNIGIGHSALSSLTGGAQSNVAMGYQSAEFVWNGNYNVAIGTQTLRGGTSLNYQYSWGGSRNVAVGYQALGSGQNANDNIAIGYQAGYNETGSNKLYIENTNSSQPLIGGDFSANKVGINRLMTDLSAASQTLQVQGDALIVGKTVISSTAAPARASLDVSGTDAIIVPVGTTAQRPTTPVVGMIRYNTTTKKYEGYAEDTTTGTLMWKELH